MERRKARCNGVGKMSLSDTISKLEMLLLSIAKDLEKTSRGNKTAAQRVRVGTIRLERVAKLFRKESVAAEKGGKMRRKAASRGKGKKGKKRNA
jgi:histone H1-like protein Hc1